MHNDERRGGGDPLDQQRVAIARLARQVRRLATVTEDLPDRVAAALSAAMAAQGNGDEAAAAGSLVQEQLDHLRTRVSVLLNEVATVAPAPPEVGALPAAPTADSAPEAADGESARTKGPEPDHRPAPVRPAVRAPKPRSEFAARPEWKAIRDRILGHAGRPPA